jgi:hypothetical protein
MTYTVPCKEGSHSFGADLRMMRGLSASPEELLPEKTTAHSSDLLCLGATRLIDMFVRFLE